MELTGVVELGTKSYGTDWCIAWGTESYGIELCCWLRELSSGVPRGGGWVVQTPHPEIPKFLEAEPNSQFRGKYIRNNLTRIRLSLIF